jgi:hypothetical protein
MDSRNEKTEGGEIRIKLPVSEKLENFWYHYKWHTIVALFAVFVLIVLTLQTCKKTETDCYILYAGTHDIRRVAENGNISEYENAISSFKRVCSDYTDDGVVSISLLDLFVVNDEEAKKLLAENEGMEINSALVKEDTDKLHQKLLYREYYLCFLSERIFKEYEARYEGAMFASIEQYTDSEREYEYASENGIYPRSLPFGSLPEISELPSDTVVCIRQLSEVSTKFGTVDNEEHFKRGEDILRKVLSYGISEK